MHEGEKSQFSSIKSLLILEAMARADGDGYVGIQDIARATGMAQSSVHRICNELLQCGYVEKNDAIKKYRIGLETLILASNFMQASSIVAAARGEMLALSKLTGETIHLLSISDCDVIYLNKIDTHHTIGLMSSIGKHNPVYCTSGGKAIAAFKGDAWLANYLDQVELRRFTPQTITTRDDFLAEMRMIREKGYATDNCEHHSNVTCVGAPIFDASGTPIASISIAAPSYRFPIEAAHMRAPDVMRSTMNISKALGYKPTEGSDVDDQA